MKILAVFEELMDETLQLLIRAHEASFGSGEASPTKPSLLRVSKTPTAFGADTRP